MPKPTEERLQAAYKAYESYVEELRAFADAMEAAGVRVRNVEPFANFAEIIAARELGGTLQRATNEGFDLKTDDNVRIQVKSLRVSSAKPKDNGIDWIHCTRLKGKKDGELIKADQLAIVVYRDFRPYALVKFPIDRRPKFPVVDRKGLFYHHVEALLNKPPMPETMVRVIDLESSPPRHLAKTPPAAPAVGE